MRQPTISDIRLACQNFLTKLGNPYNVFLSVPLVAMIEKLMTLIPKDMQGNEGWGQTCSVASLQTKTLEEFKS